MPIALLLLASLARAGLAHWRRRRERLATARALAELNEHLLRDLGLDRSDIDSVAGATAGRGDWTRVVTTPSLPRRRAVACR
ncbi:DUF1127 domain-containing protein [Caldimonas sp. KR1-144]|uniref:DUF1127 domain-containing protein n=1 Tax=Caldimonas sp. KR1-144 TaxID=3400911 RepID=UPI003BFF3DD0